MLKPKPVKPKFWLLRVFLGLGLIGLFGLSYSDYRSFEAVAVHVPGKVLRVDHESKRTGRRGNRITIYRPYVSFVDPKTHEEIEAQAKVMTRQSFDVGTTLELEFNPSNPRETLQVASGLSILDWATGVVGLALVVFAIGAQLRYRHEMAEQAPVAVPVVASSAPLVNEAPVESKG